MKVINNNLYSININYLYNEIKNGNVDLNFKEIFAAFMILFAVIDIVGNVPIIIDLRKKVGHIQSGKASLIAGIIMICFLFIGENILSLIGIDVNSFAVAGSFVLFFIALEMILGVSIYKDDENTHLTASVFPLAFPLIAGPGSLTTLLSIKSEYSTQNIIIAIIINVILIFLVLKSSKQVEKMLGQNGIQIIRKVFGVVLLAIAVKLFTTNIQGLFI